MSKTVVNRAEVHHHLQVWECPPLPQDSDFMMLQSCLDVSDDVHLMPDFHFKMMEVHVYETVTNY